MLFVRLGQIAAWILLVMGAFRLFTGAFVIFLVENRSEAERNVVDQATFAKLVQGEYLGSMTAGGAIDRGAILILAGIIIGILAQIGRSTSTDIKIDRN